MIRDLHAHPYIAWCAECGDVARDCDYVTAIIFAQTHTHGRGTFVWLASAYDLQVSRVISHAVSLLTGLT